jgi:hypothetical protein
MTPTEIEAAAPGDERRVLEWLATELAARRDSTFNWRLWYRLLHAGAYLDAAMMLVPEGWGYCVEQERPTRACEASISPPGHEPWDYGSFSMEGSTPALALCAAIAKGIGGNKRCPKATDHELDCTGSNEPGQKGSAYE